MMMHRKITGYHIRQIYTLAMNSLGGKILRDCRQKNVLSENGVPLNPPGEHGVISFRLFSILFPFK